MTSQAIITTLTSFCMWFNSVTDPTFPFHLTDLQTRFTPDCVIQMNDKIVTKDYDSLYKRFEKFRQSGYLIKMQLPLDEVVISDDMKKVVARYTVKKTDAQGKTQDIKVIAICHLAADGRLSRINEVVYSGS